MKIGYIDYLNCYPFYYHMFEKEPVEGASITPGYPSQLNGMIKSHQLDMSPISAASYAGIQDDVYVLPDFCLSSVGYVGSVILLSKTPIEDLDKKRVGLTTASHTSIVLLKVLLRKYFKVEPEYVEASPMPDLRDMDATLVIGNEAMLERNDQGTYVYDLGELWMKKTGYPVVFAVFVVQKEAAENQRSKANEIIASYRKSLACLTSERGELIRQAKLKYPNINYDIEAYCRVLKFEFEPYLKEAAMFYYRVASELQLIDDVKDMVYFTP
jgi:chorismate dehydratase